MATKKNEVAKVEEKSASVAIIQDTPDYLTGNEKSGAETLGKDDFKTPRIKLLQPLSPEINSFRGVALPTEFWHTTANKSLGTSFMMVPCIVGKRVILWKPRDDGGGILAFSKDGIKWNSGANQTFSVKIKGRKEPVIWKTGKDVPSSGLLEFGSSNPDDEQSAPAATTAYEYLCYLPEHPELSPVVLGVMRTGIKNARAFNTYLLSQRKPVSCMVIRCFSDEMKDMGNSWHVPKFEPAGYASKELYAITSKIAEAYADYDIDLEQEEEQQPVDEINY